MTTRTAPADILGADAATLVTNIVECWERAPESVHADGSTWYQRAHGIAASLDSDAPERAAGVLAALSPQTSWDHNVKLARRLYATGQASGHTRLFCSRAHAIYRDGCAPLSVLGGNKVRAFYVLLADPSDATTVCVDRHAVAVALGRTLDKRQRKVLERVGVYDYVADAYRAAALILGIPAHVVQATTWLQWRRETASGWSRRDVNVDQLALSV